MPTGLTGSEVPAALRPPLRLGIDTGGTFVDCVVLDAANVAIGAKAPATPDDPAAGVLKAVANAAAAAGLALGGLLGSTDRLIYGTTSGLNALVTRTGGRTGLLTTRGHEDALLIGRVHQKVAGLSIDEMTAAARLSKPEPLVPGWLIKGIHERMDHEGREVVPLDVGGVREAADELVAEGCDGIAISFLWSFISNAHERVAAEVVADRHPQLRVSVSSDVSPLLGEYERTAATVVNTYLGGLVDQVIGDVRRRLVQRGLAGPMYVMLSSGAIALASESASQAVATLGSGPVGGLLSAQSLSMNEGTRTLVTTDMGGTSFDVGQLADGAMHLLETPVFDRLHLAIPAVDIRSIGAGGGSVAWVGNDGGIRVGPRSAGSDPGPACYGRGGTEPTVTDADLLLGRLKPDALCGGTVPFDWPAAQRALDRLGSTLGVDAMTAAHGIALVADARMADLVRTVLMERGQDPRDYTMVAYGGAAPLHVGAYGPDVGVAEAVVPALASVYSARGLAVADWRRVHVRSLPMRAPFDPHRVAALFRDLENTARHEYNESRPTDELRLERTVDLRYGRQTHQVSAPLDEGRISDVTLGLLCDRFERAYGQYFGRSAGYREAGIEATTFRVVATAPRRREPRPRKRRAVQPEPPSPRGYRAVFFSHWVDRTPAYAAEDLLPGMCLAGPAVVDSPTTTLVLHPGQEASADDGGDVHIGFGAR